MKKRDKIIPNSGSSNGKDQASSTDIDHTNFSAESADSLPKNDWIQYKNYIEVLKDLYRKHGIAGWYHGLASSVLGSATQSFSYFYWYSIVRLTYSQLTKKSATHKNLTVVELLLGALAAAISQIFTMPIGVITTQQQTDKQHRSLYQLGKEMYTNEGLKGFWRGLGVSLVLCINPSITYGSFERMRQIFFNNKQYLGPFESFTLGMCAKSLATISTQPLIVSKAILQRKDDRPTPPKDGATKDASTKNGETKNGVTEDIVRKSEISKGITTKDGLKKNVSTEEGADQEHDQHDGVKFNGFVEALEHLWHTERFKGLYKGIAPQLLKGILVQGLLFMFKDQLDMFFVHVLKLVKKRKQSLLQR